MLLNPLRNFFSGRDVSGLYLFVTITTNKPDLDQCDARLIPFAILAAVGRSDMVAIRAPGGLLELFEKRKVALISVAEALDTGSAAGRLVITIMGAVSQWEREAIGERTCGTLRNKRSNGERVGNIEFGYRLSADGRHLEPDSTEQAALADIRNLRSNGYTLRGSLQT